MIEIAALALVVFEIFMTVPGGGGMGFRSRMQLISNQLKIYYNVIRGLLFFYLYNLRDYEVLDALIMSVSWPVTTAFVFFDVRYGVELPS